MRTSTKYLVFTIITSFIRYDLCVAGVSDLVTPLKISTDELTFSKLSSKSEPSGIAVDPKSGNVYVVSDHGEVYELSEDGVVINGWIVGGDLEGITLVDGLEHNLFLLDETKNEIIQFDTIKDEIVARFELHVPSRKYFIDMESLTYMTSEDAEEHGFFVVGSQNSGEIFLFEIRGLFENKAAGADFFGSYKLSSYKDVSGLFFHPGIQKLFAIFDREDQLILVDPSDFSVVSGGFLPGKDQEGIVVVGCNIYVAEDKLSKITQYPITMFHPDLECK